MNRFSPSSFGNMVAKYHCDSSWRFLYLPQLVNWKGIRCHYSYRSAGHFEGGMDQDSKSHQVWSTRHWFERGFTVGIGGPVGSGKTALVLQLTKSLQKQEVESSHHVIVPPLGVVTNDIFTQEDAEFLIRHEALPSHRIRAVETGGCPHAAIREDISANLTALEQLTRQIITEEEERASNNSNNVNDDDARPVPLLFCESGGDNLAAQFSSELADYTIYVIDVAGGEKIPRKGGPGITQSDLLVINKVDLAPAVGADLSIMKRDAERMRSTVKVSPSKACDHQSGENDEALWGPIVFASIRHGQGVEEIKQHILRNYQLAISTPHQHSH